MQKGEDRIRAIFGYFDRVEAFVKCLSCERATEEQ
jgi:hypothetical protein